MSLKKLVGNSAAAAVVLFTACKKEKLTSTTTRVHSDTTILKMDRIAADAGYYVQNALLSTTADPYAVSLLFTYGSSSSPFNLKTIPRVEPSSKPPQNFRFVYNGDSTTPAGVDAYMTRADSTPIVIVKEKDELTGVTTVDSSKVLKLVAENQFIFTGSVYPDRYPKKDSAMLYKLNKPSSLPYNPVYTVGNKTIELRIQ